jgi:hypothetical protein
MPIFLKTHASLQTFVLKTKRFIINRPNSWSTPEAVMSLLQKSRRIEHTQHFAVSDKVSPLIINLVPVTRLMANVLPVAQNLSPPWGSLTTSGGL